MKTKIYSLTGFIFVLILASTVYLTQMQTDARNENSINTPQKLMNAKPMEMVLIPAGEFQMGCDPDHNDIHDCNEDELPLHKVYLDDYYIDKYEVTNEQMVAFLNQRNSSLCYGNECVNVNDPDSRIIWNGNYYVVENGYNDHPVVEATWYGADIYCQENSKRLPTEAEWEKAARGKSVRTYPWGNQNPDCSLANFYDLFGTEKFCEGETKPIGSYPNGASPYGVEDMAGNVWEWVSDWYLDSYYSSSIYINPHGAATGDKKVLRGGGLFDEKILLRTSERSNHYPLFSSQFTGFRCVADRMPEE